MASWKYWIFAVSFSATANPVVVFDTFGPSNTWRDGPGITFGCGAICWSDGGHTSAYGFTPTATGPLARIDTAASAFISNSHVIELSIWSDNTGAAAASLEMRPVTVGQTFAYISANSVAHPVLMQGQQYWFVLSVPDLVNDAAQVAINPSYPDITHPGPSATRIGNGPWSVYNGTIDAVFRITIDSPVPEPRSALSLGSGLIALGLSFRYRRRCRRSLVQITFRRAHADKYV